MARIGDRRVREGLPDDRDRHALHAAQSVGLEHRLIEVERAHVLREELDRRELAFDRLPYPLGAVSEFPVRSHAIDAEQLLRADHVGAARPEGGRRALPAVATVEQQGLRARGAQAPHQRRKMGQTADLAIAPRRILEIEVGEGVREGAPCFQAVLP